MKTKLLLNLSLSLCLMIFSFNASAQEEDFKPWFVGVSYGFIDITHDKDFEKKVEDEAGKFSLGGATTEARLIGGWSFTDRLSAQAYIGQGDGTYSISTTTGAGSERTTHTFNSELKVTALGIGGTFILLGPTKNTQLYTTAGFRNETRKFSVSQTRKRGSNDEEVLALKNFDDQKYSGLEAEIGLTFGAQKSIPWRLGYIVAMPGAHSGANVSVLYKF